MIGNIDTQKLNKFCRENGVKLVVLFGSRAKEARGETVLIREDSDFDIAVLTSDDKNIGSSADNYTKLLTGLSDIFNIPDFKMDLTNLNDANILLRYEITTAGKLLYGDTEDYEELKAFAFRDYVDAKPLFDLEDFLIRKRQNLIAAAFA